LPVNNYSIVKEPYCSSPNYRKQNSRNTNSDFCLPTSIFCLVGLGRLELPTSPLSGVRSNHLSYRPKPFWSLRLAENRCLNPKSGGAGRDRTGDLLNANQALSQLSYSPWLSSQTSAFSHQFSKPTADRRMLIALKFFEADWTQPSTASVNGRSKSNFLSGDTRAYGLERLLLTQISVAPATVSLRKEVIQPQVLLRLPCYDFTPIMNHTLDRCLPCGLACRLLVQSTFVM
jgi:hypothetical protein